MNSPKEIAQNYIAIGVAKTMNPAIKTLVLGMLAGMFVALASTGATIVQATLVNTQLASVGRLLSGAVFPTGLVMVLLAGSELFTGNCLLIIPVLQRKIKIRAMLKNWLLVYIGNFAGSLLVALITIYGGTYSLFSNTAAAYAIYTAAGKVNMSFDAALLRGVLCNVLVCIAVWVSYAAKDIAGKVAALFFPIMLFVVSGYEHCVANMYFIPAGLLASANPVYLETYASSTFGGASLDLLTWGSMITRNLVPSTIGNMIGGAVLVGMAYWFIYLRET